MEVFIDLLKITLPAIIAVYGIYLVVRSFVAKELNKVSIEAQYKSKDITIPIRLQAYERICLFLERISPNNLIPRLNSPNITARELQTILLRDIREEFSHNLSQQLYMSNESWNAVKMAMEQTISLINESAGELEGEATNMDLVRIIFDKVMKLPENATEDALIFVKEEIRSIF
ncbi:MAG: hypothetical protein NXI20_21610 [bacterium]|nr:hypothetical protein [bacterium]